MSTVAVIMLMATGKNLQINKNLSHVVYPNMWRNQTSGSAFFFIVSIVVMIADKDLCCCSVASRVSSRQIQNLSCTCPMHLYQAVSILHWFAPSACAQLPSVPLSYTRADPKPIFYLAWSSSRESTEPHKRQESLASSSAMIFKWFANNSCKPRL